MHKDIAVKLQNISKVYKLYEKPIDRLKEALHPAKKKYHKDFHALDNINLEIKKGEVLGIVGINGAGKSTLLKIISGVLTPTSGRVTIKGKLNAILELGSGLKGEMTGRQNIKLNLQISGIEENVEQLIQEIIEFAGIGEHIDQPVKTYSSGMKARLGFGLATTTNPDILIVDEALSVGDAAFKLKSYARMKALMHSGCTVLYVSHSLQSVIQLCTRAILLVDHTIVESGNPKDIIEEYQHRLFSNNKDKKQIESEKEEKTYKKGYYSQELLREPKILQNYDVYIKNSKILDKNNFMVNILETGEKYTIAFDVLFKETLPNAMFGIQFKTLNGIFLYSPRDEKYFDTEIKKDTILNVKFEFKNTLLVNTYYLNLASASVINGEIKYLVEHSETLIFKVLKLDNNEKLSEFGLVRINGNIEIKESRNQVYEKITI